MTWQILTGDCVEQMRTLGDCSVDAVVCDPPYGIGFMGHEWDQPGDHGPVGPEPSELQRGKKRVSQPNTTVSFGGDPHPAMEAGRYDLSLTANRRYQAWCEHWARECLRVLKPGGHLLASCGSRTYQRMACGIEDAGFEIRDSIMWLYGSGFPKSLDVSKAIDKAADYKLQAAVRRAAVAAVEAAGLELPGNSRHDWTIGEHAPGDKWWAEFRRWLPTLSDEDREKVERETVATVQKAAGWFTSRDLYELTAAATPEAEQWQGWGTALKPAHEPIVVARKPLVGTVAANVLEHGTGALNIDACRISTSENLNGGAYSEGGRAAAMPGDDREGAALGMYEAGRRADGDFEQPEGRCPANVILDPVAAELLDEQTGELISGPESDRGHRRNADSEASRNAGVLYGDSGGASRFFYCAKTSRAERNAGLEGFEERAALRDGARFNSGGRTQIDGEWVETGSEPRPKANVHPTVKPINLMRWLVRLVTPPEGTVLDPFVGSGSTGCAAVLESFDFIGCEREEEYVAIAEARIAFWAKHVGREVEDVLGLVGASERERRRRDDMGQGSIFDMDAELSPSPQEETEALK